MTPPISGPSLGMALLALAVAVAFVRRRGGLGLLTGAVALVWAIRWFLNAPIEQLGPLLVSVDGPGLTAGLGAVVGCALGRGRARAGLAACLLAAGLFADLRFGISILCVAWLATAWVHAPPRRVMAGSVVVLALLVGAWWLGAGPLHALPPTRSIVQLRVLGAWGAGLIPVLLLPGAARSAALLAWTWGLLRFVAPLCPEAFALITPGLRWLAVGIAALGAVLMLRRRMVAPIALVACAGAWLGIATGTALGLGGAALLLAGGAIGLTLTQRDGRIGGLFAFASPALLVGLFWITWAANTVVGPVPLGGWAVAVAAAAGVSLIAALFGPRQPLEGARGLILGVGMASVLGVGAIGTGRLPGSETVAAQVGRRGIPPDDRFGWRRVEWLERFRPQPADAGLD